MLLDELRRVALAGDSDRMLALCEAHLQQSPDDADALRHLAQVRAERGEHVEAERAGKRACELAPDDPRAWSDLGRVYARAGKFEEAAECFMEAVDIDARYADGWHNLGSALKKLGRIEPAFAALKNALLIDASRAETYLTLGNLLIETAQFDDAIECFERAAKHDPGLAAARSRLADYFSSSGKARRAETLFRESLGLDPDHLHGWFGLGRTLEDLGQEEGALNCYLNVFARCPDHASAIGQYLALVRDDPEPAILETARFIMAADNVTDEARALVGHGLAKYHDRRKNPAAAAAAGLAANAARRGQAGPLDRADLQARVDYLIKTCTRDFFRERKKHGLGTDQPVFIVGLPRSGTTLTEQILASHPRLHGAGELPDLARIAAECLDESKDEDALLCEAVMKIGNESRSRILGHQYLKAVRAGASRHRLRISDKSPLNFFHLGFAALMFPNARVIHCTRDVRDNALSIWMENFNPDQTYATDFGDLAFFVSQYRRLMAHWQEHLPLRMMEMRYEDTVADIEGQARRLMDFLEVPWDPSCLDFHKADRAVQTPSRWQVRQPIYTRSVARWKAYSDYLPELHAAFAGL